MTVNTLQAIHDAIAEKHARHGGRLIPRDTFDDDFECDDSERLIPDIRLGFQREE